MDWIVVGVSVLTGYFGGKVYHGMADKGSDQLSTNANDSQKTESHPSGAKQKTKVGSDPMKAEKDNPKDDPKTGEVIPIDDQSAESLLKTTPYDPRFPNQNQTRNCYQNYLDYHRCLKVKNSESYCHYYQWAYNQLCPKAWFENWDDQRANGIFPGQI